MSETPTSANQNRHGVDLTDVAEADTWPITPHRGGRTVARIVDANLTEDEFVIEYGTAYERFERTVDGDVFLEPITGVKDPITPNEIEQLDWETEPVTAYLLGNEKNAQVWIDDYDEDSDEVNIVGETDCNTVNRWVDREYVWSPNRD